MVAVGLVRTVVVVSEWFSTLDRGTVEGSEVT